MVNEERQVRAQVVNDKTVGRGETDVDVEPELAFVVRVSVVWCLLRSLDISTKTLRYQKKVLTKMPRPYLFSPECVRHTVAASSASGWRYSTSTSTMAFAPASAVCEISMLPCECKPSAMNESSSAPTGKASCACARYGYSNEPWGSSTHARSSSHSDGLYCAWYSSEFFPNHCARTGHHQHPALESAKRGRRLTGRWWKPCLNWCFLCTTRWTRPQTRTL